MTQLLQDNIEEYIYDYCIGQDFLNKTQKDEP